MVFGWQDYDATDGKGFMEMRRLPLGVPPNLALSLFGITGPAAYLGIIQVGHVRAGETVVVSGAAGSTGSVAGQIAKIKGRPVIGYCRVLPNVSGLLKRRGSTAPSITSENVGERLSALCPNGIDVFFDNVGGKVLNGVLARIDLKARIGVSGAIALYNDAVPPPGPANGANLIVRTDARTDSLSLITPHALLRRERMWRLDLKMRPILDASFHWREFWEATSQDCRSAVGVRRIT